MKTLYLSSMKKGKKPRELAYFLEISDIRNNNWCTPSSHSSLREAVEEAEKEVQDMHHHLKVYRDFKSAGGVYIATFFSKPTDSKPARQLIVKITAYELLSDDEITEALAYIERISQNEAQPASGR